MSNTPKGSWTPTERKGKREGMSKQELLEARRHEAENRTRGIHDTTRRRQLTTRERLRNAGQKKGRTPSNDVTFQHPLNPPVSIYSSKPQIRKGFKKYLRKAQEQFEGLQGTSTGPE